MEEKNNLKQIIESSTKSLDGIVSVDKIVGEKIVNERGQTVIPISKLTVGIFGAGGEYGNVKISEKLGERFAGGSITVSSVKPECFIIDNGSGFEIASAQGAFDAFFNALTKLVKKVKK